FIVLLIVAEWPAIPNTVDAVGRFFLLAAVLYFFSRGVIDLRVTRWVPTVLLGVSMFFLWIAPDLLWPHYRESPLFHNAVIGMAQSSLSPDGLRDPVVLAFRTARAVLIVPLVEELFWRAWLMRWLIEPDFQSVPLGAYSAASFWITVVLFASEHGAYWDVGLATGIVYNWWMLRTRSLGDLIWTHAITNACLCAYVIATHRWEYWM
ncbi:MAG: CAAX prenyl protease-related protein, partial [Bryobacteraceae bacterium]